MNTKRPVSEAIFAKPSSATLTHYLSTVAFMPKFLDTIAA